ncbi:hypothetical protein F5J12DRAFT_939955 [Pisolithus orientalis]|uniref:uncharacterized protein n=1 Tax=Pisolithus orientalis TaxID=936130 RepID=UPI00222570C8|nr:uncharacterized protein F5J12DRAFT_939955 [Pisolithus orientalis]KAI6006229.1 hypothetical protein F5J12DRAFT_939955 [Pisolithus orientalis]
MSSSMVWVSVKVAQAIATVSPAKTIHVPDEYLLLGSGSNVLPHGIQYFGNPENCATTDLDLRSHARLEEVERLWRVPWRTWLTDKFQMDVRCGFGGVTRCRWILNNAPTDDGGVLGEDNCLDDKYRYWSYVKTHPAHVVLSQGSWQEAVDILHWSYTDWLLTHPQPIQPPFSQEECQELLRLPNDLSQQSTLSYTHMVAHILLHAGQFQATQTAPMRHHCHTHTKADPDAMHSSQDIDQYTVPWHPILVCGSICIILSASDMLISFLGLDGIAHIGGLVAISCSVLSTVTSFLSIFQYKAELLQGSAAVHHAVAAAHEGFIFLPNL